MGYLKDFRRKTLPHYLKVVTSVVSLADIAICAAARSLSDPEEARFRTEVESAFTEINKAVNEGQEIQHDVDNETEETPLEHNDLQEEIDRMRRELQDVEKELISQEIQKEKCRNDLQRDRVELMQAKETQNTIAAQIAEKETVRNVGIGLILIPFIGIPMVIGTLKEIKRAVNLSQTTNDRCGKLNVKIDTEEETLEQSYKKITELKLKRAEGESLREKERKEVMMKKEIDELFEAKRTVEDNLNHLIELQSELEMLHIQCMEETFYGIDAIKGRLKDLFTVIQLQSFDKELLCDSRVHSKLSELDGKVPKFNNIYHK